MVQVTASSLYADAHTIQTLYDLIDKFSKKLMAKGYMFGSAESCTGGLLATCCTDVAGSSDWYKGSIISYANAVKEKNLGVASNILLTYGAVSKETVEAMAKGALIALDIQMAVAISGVAGPSGGTLEKPVGTVWIAAALQSGKTEHLISNKFLFAGTRVDVRLAAVKHALLLATKLCER